jgi:hypothetical protein
METKTGASITDHIINGLNKAVTEIEEFRVQAALGKAEARDAFEDLKKKLQARIHEVRVQYENLKNRKDFLEVINAFEHLQVQLALGMAESKESFEDQKKKISAAMSQLESSIKRKALSNEHFINFRMELEKFKVKLELLALHYKLKKVTVQFDLENKKDQLREKIKSLRARFAEKETLMKNRWEEFSEDITDAFSQLKSSFVK